MIRDLRQSLPTGSPKWWTIGAALIGVALFRDVVIAPLVRVFLNEGYQTYLLQAAQPSEVPEALRYIVAGYAALLAGFVAGRRGCRSAGHEQNSNALPGAIVVSLLIAAIGLVGNLYVVGSLAASNGLAGMLSLRSVFYDESVIFTPLFNYARIISPLVEIGGWALIVVGTHRQRKAVMNLGLMLSVFYIGLQVLFGSRMTMLASAVGLALVWHSTIRRIGRRAAMSGVLVLVAILGLLQVTRGYAESVTAGSASLMREVGVGRGIDEMAFARRAFPSALGYLSWDPMVDALRQSFPNNSLLAGKSVWTAIVDDFYNGVNPSGGIGGEHYSFGPEHYMCFGSAGLLAISLVCGFLFGRTLWWSERRPGNPFAILIAASAIAILLATLFDGRMVTRMGSFPLLRILPLGTMAALALARGPNRFLLGATASAMATALLLDGMLDNVWTEIASLSVMSIAYAAALSAVLRFDRQAAAGSRVQRTVRNASRVRHTFSDPVTAR